MADPTLAAPPVAATLPAGHPHLEPELPTECSWAVPSMGGWLALRVGHDAGQEGEAMRELRRVARRVERWASRLTRFSPQSDLSALNADPHRPITPVRPTLAAVLRWADAAAARTDGWVDVTLLDARLAAEHADPPIRGQAQAGSGRAVWSLVDRPRGGVVHRAAPFRFDLDGVAKGWIADRALWLLRRYPAALVDADGDVAVRAAADTTWLIGVADPRAAGEDLVRLAVPHGRRGSPVGIATSGTHVHRWSTRPDGAPRHHLIDPRTGAPAATDVVQATVVASTARAAEALAKAVVVAGSEAGADLLARSGAMAAVILLASGEVIATPSTLDWAA